MAGAEGLNERELARYAERVGERWPLEQVYVGGARVEDLCGAGAQRERGAEFVVVLVSAFFDGVPWLERVHQAGALWDAAEMGAGADVHCYTPAELERRRGALHPVREAAERGIAVLVGR